MALGRKTGGGSRKGRPNRRTLARERALADAAAENRRCVWCMRI